MRYLILVSHGTFAPGLHNAVGMMAGADRGDIRSTSLLDGMDVDTYRKAFAELTADLTAADEILLFADIVGGSPLTTAMEVLSGKGLLENTVAIGGMNLPLVLTAAFAEYSGKVVKRQSQEKPSVRRQLTQLQEVVRKMAQSLSRNKQQEVTR